MKLKNMGLSLLVLVSTTIVAQEPPTGDSMTVENGSTVSIEYTLKLDDGSVVDTNAGRDPLVYTHGEGQILPALEEALNGMATGEQTNVKISAENGYGPRNEEAIREVPLEVIPEDARRVDAMLMAGDPSGPQRPVRVVEIREETALLDFNHPLAGQNLNFDVTIINVQ